MARETITDETFYNQRKNYGLIKRPSVFTIIDVFAGAGGLTLGFTESLGHSFKPVWANDFNNYAADTYNANFGKHCNKGDILEILQNGPTKIPKADVVLGGPPCQGFSLLNKKRGGDARKQLWRPYLEIAERAEAKIFLMENVPQLIGTFEHGEIAEAAKAAGYKVAWVILNAADYGVPQTRRRAFIIGTKVGDLGKVFPPLKTHYKLNGNYESPLFEKPDYVENPEPWRTVRDAISDLPPPLGTEIRSLSPPLDLHFGRNPTEKSVKRYKAIPEEGMNRFDLQKRAPEITPGCWIRKVTGGTDLFGRLWWDKPAYTIRTEFFKPEKGRYLHPVEHRPITHREAARFQTFPDSFVFKGSKIEIARQIGNAVPPVLAARLADSVYALLIGG